MNFCGCLQVFGRVRMLVDSKAGYALCDICGAIWDMEPDLRVPDLEAPPEEKKENEPG